MNAKRGLSLVLLLPVVAFGNDDAVQRALIQRDQQSAEFAAGASRRAVETLHYYQMQSAGRPLGPLDRARMARERDALPAAPQPSHPHPDYRPSPLPGGPRPSLDPVPSQGIGG